MSDLRSLERRLAVIEGRITPHTDRARRGLQHRYVSVPPIGDAYLSGTFTKMATVATVDRQINLYPLHLTRPMELRRVTLVAGAADTLQFATAIYRAGPVSDEKAALLSGTPGSRVTWQLLASCGTTAVGAGSASQTYDHDLSVDVDLDDGLLLYLAVMIGSAATTKLYLPAQSYVGGDGFVADAVGTTLGKWPDTLGAQSGVRAQVPYFILRSALGVRLFGDPLPTAVPASSVSVALAPSGTTDTSGSADTTDGTTTITVHSVDVAALLGGDGGALLEVDLIGVRQGTLETAAWHFRARVKVASGVLTVQSPRPLDLQDRDSGSGIAAATAALAASSGSLRVNVVGIAGSTIRWTARVRGVVRTQT